MASGAVMRVRTSGLTKALRTLDQKDSEKERLVDEMLLAVPR